VKKSFLPSSFGEKTLGINLLKAHEESSKSFNEKLKLQLFDGTRYILYIKKS
jgi:hypothetical protein